MAEVIVYDSFADVPLDAEPELEGDDSIPVKDRIEPRALFAAKPKLEQPAVYHVVVPYPGLLHEGSTGAQVNGVKRIVHRYAGTLPVLVASPVTQRQRWGAAFTTKLRRAQKRAGVPVTGVWDKRTHDRLAPWADAYALMLLKPPRPSKQELQRDAVLAFLEAFYNRRYAIPYSQARPSQLRPVKQITRADCSGSIACGMWTARVLPDVDWRWTNTDTQITFGEPVTSLPAARVADVVFYGHGSDPGHEACIVSAADGDERVFSFGSYPARILPVDYNRGTLGGRIAIRRFIT